MGESATYMRLVQLSPSDIGKKRGVLMGVAALLIYFAHAYTIVPADGLVGRLLSLGNLGVDFFLFLSGFGIYHSFCVEKRDLPSFYWRRFVKVGVPFLVISIPFYAFYVAFDFIFHSLGCKVFLLDITTLSYWFEHDGAWYVSALIPLYAATPLFKKLLGGGIDMRW